MVKLISSYEQLSPGEEGDVMSYWDSMVVGVWLHDL